MVELALLPESPDIIHRHAGKGLDLTVLIRRREVQGRLQSIAHHLLTLQALATIGAQDPLNQDRAKHSQV
ncbi:MAG: hypothetical protein EBT14_06340 [Betaproteobacteria bacterium]|nr:hypothetical protein [Betaproteobacteria bacterium]